jgi:hypothetical protein
MAEIGQFFRAYQAYESTFRETSHDSRYNEYLCRDTTQTVINFDQLIEQKYEGKKQPKSFDALYLHGDTVFCVEFKNQTKPDRRIVEQKLLEGKRELDTLLSQHNIAKNKYRFVFCLVYNKFVPKEERYKRGLHKSIHFEYLSRYKPYFFDDVYTEDISFFTQDFSKQLHKELAC